MAKPGDYAPCPGSGQLVVTRSYVVRSPTDEDRAKVDRSIARMEAAFAEHGDESPYSADELEAARVRIPEWEAKAGQSKSYWACCVCGVTYIWEPRRGKAPRHKRTTDPDYSWDRVYDLMEQIRALQDELQLVQNYLARHGERSS